MKPNNSHSFAILALATVISSLTIAQAEQAAPAGKLANAIAQNSIIVDGHIDVPYRVHEEWVDVTGATEDGDFDYPRAKQGGLNAPFMSIYLPAKLDGTEESTQLAHILIDSVEAIVARAPDKYAIATSPAEVKAQFKAGLISLPLGMENGAPINGNLENVAAFHQRGIRYITLTHAKSNSISDSSYDDNKQWDGLSAFGEQVVAEMNRVGIMVDISHVSDAAFYDVINTTKAPVIASHSSLRAFTPGFERNMDDDMIKALAKNGGVIMINFGSTFVDPVAREWSDVRTSKLDPLEEEFGEESQQVTEFKDGYRDIHPFPFSTLDYVVQHIDYAVKLVGIDHVGLGSDYDGVGDSLPEDLKDVSSYPRLIQGLLDKDYTQAQIEQILGGNLLRVWGEVEKIANAN